MIRPKPVVDKIYLVIFFASVIVSLIQHFGSDTVITINTYAGFLGILLVGYFRLSNSDKINWGVLALLILGWLNVFNYSAVVINASVVQIIDSFYYNTIGFNIVIFIALIIYLIVNLEYIRALYNGFEDTNKTRST